MRETHVRLILFIIVSFCFGTAWSQQPVSIVTDAWPPFAYAENDEVKGTDVEIVTSVFKKMGMPVTIELRPWKRCLAAVKNQTADAILAASITEERKQFLHFPSEPVSEGVTVFFKKKSNDLPFSGLQDLHSLRAGAILGYAYCDEIDQAPFTINASRVVTLEQGLNMLMLDRIDFFIEVDAVGHFKTKEMGISETIDIIPGANYCHGGNYLAFAKKAGHDQISVEFGKALKKFKSTREYRKILSKYGR